MYDIKHHVLKFEDGYKEILSRIIRLQDSLTSTRGCDTDSFDFNFDDLGVDHQSFSSPESYGSGGYGHFTADNFGHPWSTDSGHFSTPNLGQSRSTDSGQFATPNLGRSRSTDSGQFATQNLGRSRSSDSGQFATQNLSRSRSSDSGQFATQNLSRSRSTDSGQFAKTTDSMEVPSDSSPFPVSVGKNTCQSSEIKKSKLVSVERVVSKYSKMKTESKVGTLAVKLARQSFFGDDVMRRCTVQGAREFPGLPSAELGQLKQTIFKLFPQYWRNPSEFEGVWSTCVESVGQACKRLRSKTVLN